MSRASRGSFAVLVVCVFSISLFAACGPGKKEVEAAAKPCADRINAAWKARPVSLSAPVTPTKIEPQLVFGYDNPAVNAAVVTALTLKKGAGVKADPIQKNRGRNQVGASTNELRAGVDWITGRWSRKAKPESLIADYTKCAKYKYVVFVEETKLLKPTSNLNEGAKRTGVSLQKLVEKSSQLRRQRKAGLFFPGELRGRVTVVDLDSGKVLADYMQRTKSGRQVRGDLVKELFERFTKDMHKLIGGKFVFK